MDIRNICLLGHGGSGKTSLVESMLYITGVTDRLGKTADGNTVCDYDPEEIKRQISISLAMTPITYSGVKINVLDTPGNFDFAGEMQSGVRAAEVGVLVCASKDGLSVGAERCWKYLKEQKKPCIVYISKEDEENANFSETLAAMREKLGNSIAPVVAPIWDDNKRTIGIIDVLNRKAYKMPEGKKGKREEIPIPESKQKVLDELYNQLMEAVAETTEENMEKFFAGEPFTKDEIMTGLKVGMHEGT
ncbi:MAG: GTP-binding protein, partial [Oscillospiraceae bacterium]|nr:GTP-binding protein [Oscillospiraceae bacterium]